MVASIVADSSANQPLRSPANGSGDGKAEHWSVHQRFRAAFSHLERTDTFSESQSYMALTSCYGTGRFEAAGEVLRSPREHTVCRFTAELIPEQHGALDEYRRLFGLQPKLPWAPHQIADVTQRELELIQQMRERLDMQGMLTCKEDHAYCTDLMLLRYIRARDHHLDKAYSMYVHSLAWRREARPWAMSNPGTRTNKLSSDARIVGYDLQGRVVVYSSFAKSLERTPEHVKVNTICLMEKANACINAGSPGSVVWVNHFGGLHKSGFGWRDCHPAFAWTAIDIFSNHYPECLATMIIVDPPSVFFGLWKVVHPMLPEKTARKGDFIKSTDDNSTRFRVIFGEELAAYLLDLIKADAK